MLKRTGPPLYKTSAKQARAKGKFRVKRFQAPLYRSMRDRGVHTITKCCNIQMRSLASSGYSWNIGTVASQFFSIWLTNQTVFIWGNSTNYSNVFVPGYSDLAALFDEVMIDKVEITIMTGPDPNSGGAGNAAFGAAQIVLARDYNDKNAPTAVGDVQQYADMRVFNLANNHIHQITLRPKLQTFALDSSGAAVSSTPRRGYFRSNLDMDHYGMKGAFVNTSSLDQIHNYNFKIYYKCKTCK